LFLLSSLFSLLSSLFSFPQNVTEQSNPNLNFQDFLKGVKYAYIALQEEDQAEIDKLNYSQPHYLFSLKNYLLDIGFEDVFLTSTEHKEARYIQSECEMAYVQDYYNITSGLELNLVGLRFTSCLDDYFFLESSNVYTNDNYDEVINSMISVWYSLLGHKPMFDLIPKNETIS